MYILSFDCGIKNLAWCLVEDVADQPCKILQWEVADIDCTPATIKPRLIRFLDAQPKLLELPDYASTHVVIEKQPSKSGIGLTVQTMLEAYFTIRGQIDRERAGLPALKSISTFSAKHKLAGEKQVKGRKGYADRKKLAVDKAAAFVQNTDWKEFLASHSKKDDLADCLLQAVAYCSKRYPAERAPVRARKPVPTGDLTAANCKYLLKPLVYPKSKKARAGALEQLPAAVARNRRLSDAISKLYAGNIDTALQVLGLAAAVR